MLQIPNEPFLRELHDRWKTQPDLIIIRDARLSLNVTLDTLLRDVVRIRDEILLALNQQDKLRLLEPTQDVFIAVLVTPGYMFVVYFLAIYSIGAAIVPLSPSGLPDEAKYFLDLSNTALLVASTEHKTQATEISTLAGVEMLVPSESPASKQHENLPLSLSKETPIDLDRAASLLFTSGTTGKPKGVLHTRRAIYSQGKATSEFCRFSPADLYLIAFPMHWIGGFGMLPFSLYSAMPMEICFSVFGPRWFWKRVQAGELTAWITSSFSLRMLEAGYRELADGWTAKEHEAVRAGVRRMRILNAGSTTVVSSTKSFWAELRGRPLESNYGMTENMLLIAATPPDSQSEDPPGCIGPPINSVSVKIDEDGEILIKSPSLLKKYVSEGPDPNPQAFTPEGYLRTGDAGKLEDGRVFVLGRVSTDVIEYQPLKAFKLKIYSPEIEDALLRLESVVTATVVGVPDGDFGSRVAALISARRRNGEVCDLSLRSVRGQLVQRFDVEVYKLPTMLRVLKEGEVVPRTGSNKPRKREIVRMFFSTEAVEAGDVEVWDLGRVDGDVRPFDLGGRQ